MDELILRYGTKTISLMLLHLANQLQDAGSDIDISLIKDMADALEVGLIDYHETAVIPQR